MASFVHRLRGGRRLWAVAAVLLVVLLWRAETDWRRLQAEYLDLRRSQLAAELDAAREAANENLRFLEGEARVAEDALADRALEVEEARERRHGLERRLREAERRLRRAQSRGDADAALQERITVEGLREQVAIAGEAVDALRADVLAAEAALDEARRPLDELADRLDAVDDFAFLRDLPGLRALAPGIHRREVRIATGEAVPRVDRCVTCHLGALGDAPDAAASPAVFAPHPRPDLYLAARSPHPYEEVGCTACHGGDGRAVGYEAAGHGTTIRSGTRVESGCVSCHDGPWIAGAPNQEAGRRWVTFLRCAACHETGRPDVELPGPSLVDLPRRMHPAWAARWIADPAGVRPTAWMPHLFDGVAETERHAEVGALVTWLWHRAQASEAETSEAETMQDATRDDRTGPEPAGGDDGDTPPEPLGDAERGEALWSELACAACHVRDAGARREDFLASPHRLRGPHLAGLADRYRDREPALVAYLHEEHAPGLHLSGDEAADLAEAILGEPTGPAGLPSVDPEVRDRVLRDRLRRVTTVEDADARMESLGPVERDLLLGELTVERYRCAACHELPDPTGRGPVSRGPASLGVDAGPSLHHVGQRPELLPAAGEPAWPHGTTDPTLPRWRLSLTEREALSIQLAGWRPPPLGEARAATPPDRGETLLARHGCRACHPLAGGPGIENVPPLDDAGSRLRSRWIFDLLQRPDEMGVRPWLGVPMPRFPLDPGERSAIAEHFAAEAGVPLLTPEPSSPDPARRALGAAVYDILQCGRCHLGNSAEEGPALPIPAMAPDYRRSGERLRRDWLVRFLLDPPEGHPMPEIFPRRGEDRETEAGRDATYLLASLEMPMFDVQRRRLERFFAGTDEMEAAFDDPRRVAEALADYMLSEDFASSGSR